MGCYLARRRDPDDHLQVSGELFLKKLDRQINADYVSFSSPITSAYDLIPKR
ncbi:hypothetical protein AB7M49_003234 [Bradyrhizobium elkanii]